MYKKVKGVAVAAIPWTLGAKAAAALKAIEIGLPAADPGPFRIRRVLPREGQIVSLPLGPDAPASGSSLSLGLCVCLVGADGSPIITQPPDNERWVVSVGLRRLINKAQEHQDGSRALMWTTVHRHTEVKMKQFDVAYCDSFPLRHVTRADVDLTKLRVGDEFVLLVNVLCMNKSSRFNSGKVLYAREEELILRVVEPGALTGHSLPVGSRKVSAAGTDEPGDLLPPGTPSDSIMGSSSAPPSTPAEPGDSDASGATCMDPESPAPRQDESIGLGSSRIEGLKRQAVAATRALLLGTGSAAAALRLGLGSLTAAALRLGLPITASGAYVYVKAQSALARGLGLLRLAAPPAVPEPNPPSRTTELQAELAPPDAELRALTEALDALGLCRAACRLSQATDERERHSRDAERALAEAVEKIERSLATAALGLKSESDRPPTEPGQGTGPTGTPLTSHAPTGPSEAGAAPAAGPPSPQARVLAVGRRVLWAGGALALADVLVAGVRRADAVEELMSLGLEFGLFAKH